MIMVTNPPIPHYQLNLIFSKTQPAKTPSCRRAPLQRSYVALAGLCGPKSTGAGGHFQQAAVAEESRTTDPN